MHALKETTRFISRLTQQAAFDSLRSTKKRWVSKGFAVQAIPNTLPSPTIRFCVIASKKTAKHAVDRNRMRRRIKAVALEVLPQNALSSMDYMLVARRNSLTLSSDDLRRDMVWCLKRLELLKNDP